MAFAIKAGLREPDAKSFAFEAQKTMYGGKRIASGDVLYVFASENEGGQGLCARALVTVASAVPLRADLERQTPRVTVEAQRTGVAKRRLGRAELKPFCDWGDGRPESELNFKFYRQATNKIVGVTDETAAFLEGFF